MTATAVSTTSSATAAAATTDSLNEAWGIYLKDGTSNKAPRDKITALINTALTEWQQATKQYKSDAEIPAPLWERRAKIFFLSGCTQYDTNKPESYKYFKTSLAVQLASHKLINATGSYIVVSDIAVEALNSLQNEAVAKLLSQNKDQAYMFGITLRWLGHARQNIKGLNEAPHCETFVKIYGLAVDILKACDTKESRYQIAEILYNTNPFMHSLKNPGATEGEKMKTLDDVIPYLQQPEEKGSVRATKLQAQIYNRQQQAKTAAAKKETDLKKKEALLREGFALISQSVQIANTTKDFPSFFKTLFTNNRASLAMTALESKIELAKMEEIGKWIAEIVKDMEAENYNNSYHVIFLRNAAKYAMYTKDFATAEKHLAKAEEVNNLDFDQEEQDLINALRAMLTQLKTPASAATAAAKK